jgi:hypothetical protein
LLRIPGDPGTGRLGIPRDPRLTPLRWTQSHWLAIIAGAQTWRPRSTPIRFSILAFSLMVGCATAGPTPEDTARSGTPLGRSSHLRSGQFTYRLGGIEQRGSDVRVDFSISNGTHRDYNSVLIRVILFGDGGGIRTVELPIGAIRAEQSKPQVARIDEVPFRVRDLTVELVYAL